MVNSLRGNIQYEMVEIMIIRTLFNKGSRVPLRGKVNEAVTTGVRVVALYTFLLKLVPVVDLP